MDEGPRWSAFRECALERPLRFQSSEHPVRRRQVWRAGSAEDIQVVHEAVQRLGRLLDHEQCVLVLGQQQVRKPEVEETVIELVDRASCAAQLDDRQGPRFQPGRTEQPANLVRRERAREQPSEELCTVASLELPLAVHVRHEQRSDGRHMPDRSKACRLPIGSLERDQKPGGTHAQGVWERGIHPEATRSAAPDPLAGTRARPRPTPAAPRDSAAAAVRPASR